MGNFRVDKLIQESTFVPVLAEARFTWKQQGQNEEVCSRLGKPISRKCQNVLGKNSR